MADPPETLLIAPSLYRRLAALLYESIVLFGVVWLAALVYALAVGQRSGVVDRHGLQAAVFVALALYFIGFWSGPGQTVAMRAWRLRLVDARGPTLAAWTLGLAFCVGLVVGFAAAGIGLVDGAGPYGRARSLAGVDDFVGARFILARRPPVLARRPGGYAIG
jgi:RDD family.